MTSVLMKDTERETDAHRGKEYVRIKVEIKVVQPQAKE